VSAGPVDTDALLRRFKPQLRYDSQEAFFADSAAEMTRNPHNTLRRAPLDDEDEGALIAAADATDALRKLSLDLLAASTYTNGEAVQPGDRLGILGTDYRTQYVRLRTRLPELRNRIYGHAATDSGGRLWLQYWFFYFYNDYHLAADFGLHEGDWEMVQLRMHGDAPDLAVYAQHRNAEERPWSDVLRVDGKPDTPLVYPGRGSHASYFEPGLYETEAWFDIADGKRTTPELELEIVQDASPPWIAWPGQWGDTEPSVPGLEQPSPAGPAAHGQWVDPDLLRATAIRRTPTRPQPPPDVVVSRRDDRLHVAYDFTNRTGPEPSKLVVTVNSADEKGVPPRTWTFGVESTQSGEIVTRLDLAPDRRYDVYTSVTAAADAHGVPSASVLTELGPDEPRVQTGHGVVSHLKRAVWSVTRVFSRGR
jgi:hypothetical protein